MYARRLTLTTMASLCVLVSGLACLTSSALAAAPEVPETGKATGVTATTATLHGLLNPAAPGELGEYQFVYKISETECEGESAAPNPANIALGLEKEPASVALSGLQPNVTYTFCLLERNAAQEASTGLSVTFTTSAAAPTIESESASDVSATAAELAAEINPGGAGTTYHFEYGTTDSYDQSTPESLSIGSNDSGDPAGAHIQSLQPATVYHYRVIATNPQSPDGTPGPDQTFTTPAAGETGALPDNRQWELVSPPVKEGGEIPGIGEESFIQAAADGGAIAYTSFLAPTEPNPAGFTQQAQVFSSRGPEGGWSSRDINTPHEEPIGPSIGQGGEYKFFSPDLSLGLVDPFGDGRPPLSARATERTVYVRDDAPVVPGAGESALYAQAEAEAPAGSDVGYLPLVTPADVLPGTKFGGKYPIGNPSGVNFAGASPDLNHVVLRSSAALTANAAKVGLEDGLYDWSGGRLELVSVLPGAGEEPVSGSLGLHGGSEQGNITRDAVSIDGSRVFWSGPENHLYMRDTTKSETVQLDVPEPECLLKGECEPEPNEQEEAEFQTASSDGSKVFFTDNRRLTIGAGAKQSAHGPEPDLYECEMVEHADKPTCDLTDLTPLIGAEHANVRGVVIGASEDGSYLYLVAEGVLAEGATPGDNLYVLHDSGGVWTTRFIAQLSGADHPDWLFLKGMPARVSPDGQYVAFMSEKSLTGYDNLDANSGQPDEEVFLYHAETSSTGELEPGRLICASCDPSGARPVGIQAKEAPSQAINEDDVWPTGTWLAADVPGWDTTSYQPRYLSDSGRLFFNSVDPLVPQAANGVADVYESEPSGEGSCASSSTASGGCVALVSAASSGEESVFLDASEDGDDVFFLTSARLARQDTDTAFDVYDAHVCAAAEPCPVVTASPPSCTTADACRAAPTPQPAIYGAPSSATVSGAGNVVAGPPAVNPKPKPLTRMQKLAKALSVCRKKPKGKRRACDAQARKKYGPINQAKTAGRSRRGN